MNIYYKMAREFLGDLISFDTTNVPGNEKPLAHFIAEKMEPYGFDAQFQEVGNNRSNVILTYGQSENKVIFTGHLDIVPAGDNWSIEDPFKMEQKNDKLYGRGACDMKAGIAAMMAAAIKCVEDSSINNCEVQLVFVADEERDGLGTKFYVSHSKPTDHTIVIIGEPTLMELNIAHRGVTRFKVKIRGRQCHAGRPQEGINAIYLMAKFAEEIEALDRERQKLDCGILPPPNITVTKASAGISDNIVPEVAEMILDCRTVPGESEKSLKKEIYAILSKLFDDTDVKYDVSSFIDVMPGIAYEDQRVCMIAKNAYQATFGSPAPVTYFKACCDMSAFCAGGYTECILCGPGSLDQAHTVDEYVSIEQLNKAVDLYTAVIEEVNGGKL